MTCYNEDIIDGFSFRSFVNEDECKKEYSEYLKAQFANVTPLKVEPKTRHTRYHTVEPRARTIASVIQPKEAIYVSRLEKTYSELINEAFINLEQESLYYSEISQYITNKYISYSKNDIKWQQNIRNLLSNRKKYGVITQTDKGCYKYFRILNTPIKKENAVIERENETNINEQPVFKVPLKVEPVIRHRSSEPRASTSSARIQPNENNINRPEKTYLELINEAFTNSNQKPLSVREICQYIANNYDYYDLSEVCWQRGVGSKLCRTKEYFTKIANLAKENTFKYIPVKPKDVEIKKEIKKENENELNSLRESIRLKDDELKCLKETLARERQENQIVIDLLRYEFQIKLSELQEEREVITKFLSNYASQCVEID
jgi:hypothetical protein